MKLSPFTQEESLTESPHLKMKQRWQQGLFDSFSGVSGVSVHYAALIQNQNNTPCLVIVPGRSESYLKYQELAFDLYSQGYNIFIIDHRGQGLSDRLLPNPNKGYVKAFQDYVDDLAYLINNVVTKHCSTKPYILAHSMGAAIATRFMQESPDAIKAAVISSPMLGFNTGPIPKVIVKVLIAFQLKLNKLVSKTPWYFSGQKNYRTFNFESNKLSHSAKRYKIFQQLYQANKAIQLGGVTSHWLSQCIKAQKKIFANLSKLDTPILLLQAGSDSVVCLQAQNDFCRQLHALKPGSCPGGSPTKIDNAYHELFFEIDSVRNSALEQALTWFKQHN